MNQISYQNISLTSPEKDIEILYKFGAIITLMAHEKSLKEALIKLVSNSKERSGVENYLNINISFLYVTFEYLPSQQQKELINFTQKEIEKLININ